MCLVDVVDVAEAKLDVMPLGWVGNPCACTHFLTPVFARTRSRAQVVVKVLGHDYLNIGEPAILGLVEEYVERHGVDGDGALGDDDLRALYGCVRYSFLSFTELEDAQVCLCCLCPSLVLILGLCGCVAVNLCQCLCLGVCV